jgi:hypothetical protein
MCDNNGTVIFFDRYDLVDLTRQVLSKLANQVYIKAVTSFQEKNIDDLHLNSHKFLQLIKDIDLLLASDDNFLLGTWLESAKKLAVNPSELKQVRTNCFCKCLKLLHFSSYYLMLVYRYMLLSLTRKFHCFNLPLIVVESSNYHVIVSTTF